MHLSIKGCDKSYDTIPPLKLVIAFNDKARVILLEIILSFLRGFIFRVILLLYRPATFGMIYSIDVA